MSQPEAAPLVGIELLTPSRVAEALGLSVRTLEKMRTVGSSLKFVRLGRRILYDPQDVRAFIEANKYTNTSQVQVRRHAA